MRFILESSSTVCFYVPRMTKAFRRKLSQIYRQTCIIANRLNTIENNLTGAELEY